jgi:hypothetical protein
VIFYGAVFNLTQVGKPNKKCKDDHDGKPRSSKLAMGLKLAAAGADLVMAGADLVEGLGQLLIFIDSCYNYRCLAIASSIYHYMLAQAIATIQSKIHTSCINHSLFDLTIIIMY